MSDKTKIHLIAAVKYSMDGNVMKASEAVEMARLMQDKNNPDTMIKPFDIKINDMSEAVGFIADIPVDMHIDVRQKVINVIRNYNRTFYGKIICIYSDSSYIPIETYELDEAVFLVNHIEYLHIQKSNDIWKFNTYQCDFIEVTAGHLDKPNLNILEARDKILDMLDKNGAVIKILNLNHFHEEMEKTQNGEDTLPLPRTLDYALM